jgi:cysteine-rich repeat protein
MKTRGSLFVFAVGALALLSATHAAAATTWLVPGDGSNTCTTGSPNCDTLALAVAAATAGDTISITAASTPVTSTVAVNKQLTIAGAGMGSTTVAATGVTALDVQVSGVVVQDLTISGASYGVHFTATSAGSAITGVGFTGNAIGVRMSSTSTVSGLAITGSSFSGNGYGIYQANEGNTSTLAGLTVDGCTFTNNTTYAIYAEEMAASSIEDSTFTGGGNGILIIKFSAANATPVSDIGIRRNVISGMAGTSIELQMRGMALGTPGITVEGNTITKDVGNQTTPSSTAVFVRLLSGQPNGQVDLVDNSITLTGTYGVGTQTHGVQLIGNGPVVLTGNTIDGGGVGGSGTAPASSGVYVQSKSASVTTDATASFTGSCNRIRNFHRGVSVFDTVGAAYGGLAGTATVSFANNAIEDNDQFQVANGATPTLDFENNWWGCQSGCDVVTGAVDTTPALTAPPVCVACAADADCDDGLFCNGVETCNIGTSQCVAGAGDPCVGGAVCNDVCNEAADDCVVADGAACDDSQTCTIEDQCVAGVCVGDPNTCGDGTTQGACGEVCDDGNMTSGDGCSATCQPEFVCTPTPLSGCRTSPTGKSQLQLKKKGDVKDQAQWKWGKGQTTPKADFGNPVTGGTDYQLCIYANGSVVSKAFIPAGGNCGTKPCWKENAKGFQYKDKEASPDGVTQLQLKEGLVDGKAQIQVKEKGSNIDFPSLPLALPVRVQLKNANGVCWETIHGAPAAKNDGAQYKDKND